MLTRIVGNVIIRPDVLTTAAVIAWAQGILPVTRQAFSAAAVPLPQIDVPGWTYQQAGSKQFPALTSGGGEFEAVIPIDSKSRRNIPKSGNILFHIMRNIGGVSLEFQLFLRVLYRLP